MVERSPVQRSVTLVATAISFLVFAIGGLVLSYAVFPLIHVWGRKHTAQRRCRYVVHIAFRIFMRMTAGLGLVEWHIHHADRLTRERGQLIVPNHPSLIDAVATIAQIPDVYCLAKASHWRNPFLLGAMRATGYISNAGGPETVEKCAELLRQGENLLLFPEGTRTVANQPLKLQRGAVAIALTAGVKVTPVIIRVTPPFLQKGRPWFDVPPVPPRFEIDVHPPMDLCAGAGNADRLSTRSRRATRELSHYFQTHLGVEYGQPG